MDGGEFTDKGTINQKAVLRNRASLVEELYAGSPTRHRNRPMNIAQLKAIDVHVHIEHTGADSAADSAAKRYFRRERRCARPQCSGRILPVP